MLCHHILPFETVYTEYGLSLHQYSSERIFIKSKLIYPERNNQKSVDTQKALVSLFQLDQFPMLNPGRYAKILQTDLPGGMDREGMVAGLRTT